MAATATAPAMAPPPGVQPNFAHPESLATISDITIGLCVAAATVFFVARSGVRLFIKRSWIWEDWFALIAWSGTVAYCAAIAATMAHHGGEHDYDLTVAESEEAAYWFSVATIIYGVTIPFTKLTILWLYRRVFVSHRWSPLDISVVSLAIIQGCFYVATTLVKIFQCTPRERIWDKSVPGTCVNTSIILNTSGIFNVISDILILILPIYTVAKLHMGTKKKALVLLVFTFGVSAPAFSIAGLVQRLRTSAAPDFTWDQPGIQFWGAAELTTGLLCFSLPELGVLIRGKDRRTRSRGYTSDPYGASSRSPSRRTRRSGFTQPSHSMRSSQPLRASNGLPQGPYVELRPGQRSYDIYGSRPHADPTGHELNNVTVRKEVFVEVEDERNSGEKPYNLRDWP